MDNNSINKESTIFHDLSYKVINGDYLTISKESYINDKTIENRLNNNIKKQNFAMIFNSDLTTINKGNNL
jgi:hypothetical protein